MIEVKVRWLNGKLFDQRGREIKVGEKIRLGLFGLLGHIEFGIKAPYPHLVCRSVFGSVRHTIKLFRNGLYRCNRKIGVRVMESAASTAASFLLPDPVMGIVMRHQVPQYGFAYVTQIPKEGSLEFRDLTGNYRGQFVTDDETFIVQIGKTNMLPNVRWKYVERVLVTRSVKSSDLKGVLEKYPKMVTCG